MTLIMSANRGGNRVHGVRKECLFAAAVAVVFPAVAAIADSERPMEATMLAAAPSVERVVAPAMVPVAPAVPSFSYEEALAGLDLQETADRLGTPTDTEERAPARVWRYVRDGCTLRVFFFMDMTSRTFRALSFDMTTTQDARDDHEQCFADLFDHDRTGYGGGYGSGHD